MPAFLVPLIILLTESVGGIIYCADSINRLRNSLLVPRGRDSHIRKASLLIVAEIDFVGEEPYFGLAPG